jgi:hypothetical protein
VEFLSTDLPATYKGLIEKKYTWIEAKEVSTNGALIESREHGGKFSRQSSWEAPRGKNKGQQRFSPYCKGHNHDLLESLTKTPKEIFSTERVANAFEPPPRMASKGRNRDMTKYCHFHEDFGYETNSCRELKKQIEETVRSGQLTHIVKGISKGKEKIADTQLEKNDVGEAPILMVRRGGPSQKRKEVEESTPKMCPKIDF